VCVIVSGVFSLVTFCFSFCGDSFFFFFFLSDNTLAYALMNTLYRGLHVSK